MGMILRNNGQQSATTKAPVLYNVILLAEHLTPHHSKVFVLRSFFHISDQDARELIHQASNFGRAVCGSYTYDIAATKIRGIHSYCEKNQLSLRFVLQECSCPTSA